MSSESITVIVDGRELELTRDGLTGRDVLMAAGGDPERRDVLIRDDGGAARLVAPTDPVEAGEGAVATFRVHRNGGLRHLKVDGRLWEWGAAGIQESDIREIADVADDVGLFLANGGGEPLRRGSMVDLTADWVPHVVTRQVAPERATVPVVVNGRSRELVAEDVTYEDLVGLAFPDRRDLANRMFTVTYRDGPADRPEGSLVPTQRLHATRGTVINVTATDKS